MILGAGQRGQDKELENIERQLPLDDLDIAQNGLPGITGEPDDVAGTGDRAMLAPLLQHRAVFGNPVLALLGRDEIVGIDILQTDKYAADTGQRRFLDEVWDAVTQGVHLDREADLQALDDPQLDHAIKERFPMPVASKVIVGDKEPPVALPIVFPDRAFEIVGGAKPALAALDVDDGAERTLVGTAAAEIQARQFSANAADMLARQDRRGFPLERREIAHEVVERLKRAFPGVPHHLIESAVLGLAGKEGNAQRCRLAHLLRHFRQHYDAAGNMEAADADRQAGAQKWPRQIDGTGKLVRLNADQPDEGPASGPPDHPDDPIGPHTLIGLVIGVDANCHVGAEHAASAGVPLQDR